MKQLLAIIGALLICGTTAAIAGTCAADKPREGYTAVRTTVTPTDEAVGLIVYDIKPLPYVLPDDCRAEIESVVEAEAGAESLTCQTAVANCLYNALLKHDGNLDAALSDHTRNRPTPSASVREAVQAVFDNGDRLLDDDVLYYVNPKIQSDKWHKTQRYVCTIGSLDFYAEVEA